MISNRRKSLARISAKTELTTDADGVVKERFETESGSITVSAEPPFVKLYLQDIAKLLDIPTGPNRLMMELVQRVTYDGVIALTAGTRERIADNMGIAKQTFANYLHDLVKRDVIRQVGRGDYELNPKLFGRGNWKDVIKRRLHWELSVQYDADGGRVVRGGPLPTQLDIEDILGTAREVA